MIHELSASSFYLLTHDRRRRHGLERINRVFVYRELKMRELKARIAALEEISRNRGILYDTDAVAACLALFEEKRFSFDS
ncbi:MAG: hypothetical protein PHF23_05585 [Smithellaceae bacterium]|jgi:hypothetical protein|nr:hypothetical protein [Smithellaceae bacterium]